MSGGPIVGGPLLVALVTFALLATGALLYGAVAGISRLVRAETYAGLAMVAFGLCLVLATTLAYRIADRRSDARFVLANTALQLTTVLAFGLVVLRRYLDARWVLFAVALVLFIQGGAYAFAAHWRKTVRRLFQDRVPPPLVEALAARFQAHSLGYFALPLGCLAGAIVGATNASSAQETIRLCVLSVLGLLLLSTGAFLWRNARTLAESRVQEQAREDVDVAYDDRRYLRTVLPTVRLDDERSVAAAIDAIVIDSDFRRMLLLNQYQQLAVFLACGAAAALVAFERVSGAVVLVACLAATILATQVPYVIGQQRARAILLDRARGAQREELRERLGKLAPLAPQFDSWMAFTASGGAGAFAFKLLEKALEDLARR